MKRVGGAFLAGVLLLGCGGQALRVAVGDSAADARRAFELAGLQKDNPPPPLFPAIPCDSFESYWPHDGSITVCYRDGVVVAIEEWGAGRGGRSVREIILPTGPGPKWMSRDGALRLVAEITFASNSMLRSNLDERAELANAEAAELGDEARAKLRSESLYEECRLPGDAMLLIVYPMYLDEKGKIPLNRDSRGQGDIIVFEKKGDRYRFVENVEYFTTYSTRTVEKKWYMMVAVGLGGRCSCQVSVWQAGRLKWLGAKIVQGSRPMMVLEDDGGIPDAVWAAFDKPDDDDGDAPSESEEIAVPADPDFKVIGE